MKHLRYLLVALLFAMPVRAQEVTDTLVITIQGTVTEAILTAEYLTPPRVGDSIIFRAVVVDEDGDPINALIEFFTEDADALTIEAITDPTTPLNEGMARGIALRKATVRIWVRATPIAELVTVSFRDGELNWSGNDTILVGEEIAYCAYLFGTDGKVAAQSALPPRCPLVDTALGPYPLPVLARADLYRWGKLLKHAGEDPPSSEITP